MSLGACNSVRQFLKDSTVALHDEVEARLLPLFATDAAGYAEFLRVSAAAVIPLERSLEANGPVGGLPDWNERSRRAALLQDLADMGMDEPAGIAAPVFDGEARQLGALYVLEGSRLGAVHLARRALSSLSPEVRRATRYLRHGAGRRFWPSFLQHLESSQAVRGAPDEAVLGARAAFGMFAAPSAVSPDA